jgi:hypothetical protein
MGLEKFDEMSEEQLQEELRKIREERSGKGRVRVRAARQRRIEEGVRQSKRRAIVKAEEEAEWI